MLYNAFTPTLGRRVGVALLRLAALGTLFAFVTAIGSTLQTHPETRLVESWWLYGFLVFAGLYALLARRPQQLQGMWALVLFHQAATAITALTLLRATPDASSIAVVDGLLTLMTIAAYLLTEAPAANQLTGRPR